jgi:hypothetical protein
MKTRNHLGWQSGAIFRTPPKRRGYQRATLYLAARFRLCVGRAGFASVTTGGACSVARTSPPLSFGDHEKHFRCRLLFRLGLQRLRRRGDELASIALGAKLATTGQGNRLIEGARPAVAQFLQPFLSASILKPARVRAVRPRWNGIHFGGATISVAAKPVAGTIQASDSLFAPAAAGSKRQRENPLGNLCTLPAQNLCWNSNNVNIYWVLAMSILSRADFPVGSAMRSASRPAFG